MFFIFELLIIISYLCNDYLGFAVTGIFFVIIGLQNNKSKFNKFFDMLILSLPLHSISFIGNKFHHFLSWPILFLTLLCIYNLYIIICNKIKIEKKILFFTIIGLLLLMICNFRFDIVNGLIEIVQVSLMILPILTTFICRNHLIKKLSKKNCDDNLLKIEHVILATACATIFQYLLFTLFGFRVGKITNFPNRDIFDLFFKGYSVLSLFLGIGLVIISNKIFNLFINKQLKLSRILLSFISLIIIFLAIVINSSRTGLLAFIITMFFIILSSWKKLSKKNKFLILSVSILISFVLIFILSNSRKDMHSFFSDNQRSLTYAYACDLIFNNPISFLIGNGLDSGNYDKMMPHNFILETLTTCGILFSSIIFVCFYKLIVFLKYTKYKLLIFHIIIGSMFITCFQGNPFTTIIIILAIIDQSNLYLKGVSNGKE